MHCFYIKKQISIKPLNWENKLPLRARQSCREWND